MSVSIQKMIILKLYLDTCLKKRLTIQICNQKSSKQDRQYNGQKAQNDKQLSTKHYTENKLKFEIHEPTKSGDKFRYSRRVCNSYSANGTC